MKNLSLIILMFCACLSTKAQLENDNWAFGCAAGITFNGGGMPTNISSSVSTREGVASISDAAGNLLFYTDGITIWNGAGIQQFTGMGGHSSSTSSAIIVPNISAPNLYWIFTVDLTGSNGIRYYSYDINNPAAIVIPPGNPLVGANNTEKITAVRQCGNFGYWVSTILADGNIRVWNVGNAVTQITPDVSTIGILTSRQGSGYMKFSNNGSLLAIALPDENTTASPMGAVGLVHIYNFNNASGVVAPVPQIINLGSPITTATATGSGYPYGIEFSPNDQYLYIATFGTPNIMQFDIGNPTLTNIDTGPVGSSYGALQLGPDGIIYSAIVINDGAPCGANIFLGGIVNSNLPSPTHSRTQVQLGAGTGSHFGLPTVISGSVNLIDLTTVSACIGSNDGSATATVIDDCGSTFTFNWVNGLLIETGTQSTVTGLAPGNYSVDITDSRNNTITETFTIVGEECGCCPLPTLVNNGLFNNPYNSSDFSSDYTLSNNPTTPGEFGIVNSSGASATCNNWDVVNNTSCDPNGQFMVVNGLTSQTSNSNNVIWQQTVTGANIDDPYRFCADFKNLPQCCFDILPSIMIQVNPGQSSQWITINADASQNCTWQSVEFNFTATSTTFDIQIVLDQTTLGDGNDLAIDGISLYQLPQTPVQITVENQSISSTTCQLTASLNTLSNADDILPDVNCDYTWLIGEMASISPPTFVPGTIITGGSTSAPVFPLTTNFPGFNCSTNVPYLIFLAVNCNNECEAEGSDYQISLDGGRIIQLSDEEESLLFEQIEDLLNNNELPEYSVIESSTKIYPNPNNGNFMLEVNDMSILERESVIEILNSNGQKVYSTNKILKTNNRLVDVKVESGAYLFRVLQKNKVVFSESIIIVD